MTDYSKRDNPRRLELRKHLHPLSNRDIAEIIGVTTAHVHHIFSGRCHLYPERYEELLAIDVGHALVLFPDVRQRVYNRLTKIVNEYEGAASALKEYF